MGSALCGRDVRGSESMNSRVRDNIDRSRFELDVDGQVAFANYWHRGAVLVIHHVEAPVRCAAPVLPAVSRKASPSSRGPKREKIAPMCSHAHAWIRRYKEHHDLPG